MKHYFFKFILTLLIVTSLFEVKAQESIVTSGGNLSGSNGNLSYSIGQIVYTTHMGDKGSLAQGVQQAYEISVALDIDENLLIELKANIFPNPTVDILSLEIENEYIFDFSYALFDNNGRIIQQKKLNSNKSEIDMSELQSGIYFLKIMQENKEVKIFKIIKN